MLAYISLEIGYFELGHYDFTVMSFLGCCCLFWNVRKEETPSYTLVSIRWVCVGGCGVWGVCVCVCVLIRGDWYPLWKDVFKKKFGKTRVNVQHCQVCFEGVSSNLS